MLFKPCVMRSTISLFLASWIVAFSICGVDTFVPAFLGPLHHASHSTDTDVGCQQACLARSLSSHDLAVVQQGTMPLQPELQTVAHAADSFLSKIETLSDLPRTLIGFPSSTKLYQRVSTYRL